MVKVQEKPGNGSPKAACLSTVEQSLADSIADGLPSNVDSVCRQENIHDGTAHRGNGQSFMLSDVQGREIGSMDRYPLGALPT